MRRLVLLALVIALVSTGLWLGGTMPLARIAIHAGLPQLALPLIDDPMWRGILLYRQGAFAEAAESFRQVGAGATYNRANALARAGLYRESIENYNAVLARDPGDEQARLDRELVISLYDAPVGDARPGDDVGGDGSAEQGTTPSLIQAVGAGSGTDQSGNLDLELLSGRQASNHVRVRQNFMNRGIIANRQWLATLPDQPGRYLKARIRVEHERRQSLGLSMPPAEDPR